MVKRIVKRDNFPVTIVETDREVVPVVCLSDMHVGNETFDEGCFKNVLAYVLRTKAYVIGGGDWIENATRYSVGAGVYSQKMPPKDQLNKVVEMLSVIPNEQWLGAVTGNHEVRSLKDSGIDMMAVMCQQLDIPYFQTSFYGIISKKDEIAYSIYFNHSRTSGKSKGNEEASMERDWEKFLNFDIIGKAHGHYADLSEPKPYLTMDLISRTVVEKERYLWMSGGYLGWAGSYAEETPYRPQKPGTVALLLNMKHKHKLVQKEIVR